MLLNERQYLPRSKPFNLFSRIELLLLKCSGSSCKDLSQFIEFALWEKFSEAVLFINIVVILNVECRIRRCYSFFKVAL